MASPQKTHYIDNILTHILQFINSCVQLFTNYGLLLFPLLILLVGITLEALNVAFFYLLPIMARSYKVVAAIFNIIAINFELMADIVIVAIDAIIAFIKLFDHHMKYVKLLKIKTISATALHDWFLNIVSTCNADNNTDEIITRFFKLIGSKGVCPLLRVTRPLPVTGPFLQTTLGWLSVDSDAAPSGNNCYIDDTEWLCVALDAGYIVKNVVFPVVLGLLILTKLAPPLLTTFYDLYEQSIRFIVRIPKHIQTLL